MAHPHEEHLRSTTDKLNAGDMEGFLAAHAEDVTFNFAGKGPLAGTHKGRGEVGAVFGKMIGLLDEPPRAEIHDCLANDDHGVLLVTQHLKRGGRSIDIPLSLVFHFRDGLVSEVWLNPRDQYAADEFFA